MSQGIDNDLPQGPPEGFEALRTWDPSSEIQPRNGIAVIDVDEDPEDVPVVQVSGNIEAHGKDGDGAKGNAEPVVREMGAAEAEASPMFVESSPPNIDSRLEVKIPSPGPRIPKSFEIIIPRFDVGVEEYFEPPSPTDFVTHILGEHEKNGELIYTIEFKDGTINKGVSLHEVLAYPNGKRALDEFNEDLDLRDIMKSSNGPEDDYREWGMESEDEFAQPMVKRRRLRSGKQRSTLQSVGVRVMRRSARHSWAELSEDSDIVVTRSHGRSTRSQSKQTTTGRVTKLRPKLKPPYSDDMDELAQSDEDDILADRSDVAPRGRGEYLRKRKRRVPTHGRGLDIEFEVPRRSTRANKNQKSMKDAFVDGNDDDSFDEYRTVPELAGIPKVFAMKENFKPVPLEFREYHTRTCDTCGQTGSGGTKGPLVFCQGCSLCYHKNCLGYRSGREHIVTKIGDQDFVLQCRFCISIAKKKDTLSPSHDMCQGCNTKGRACHQFSEKKTARQEERVRLENGGDDPSIKVNPNLINSQALLLFRCMACHRGSHFECLPPRWSNHDTTKDVKSRRALRLSEYSSDWKCKDCSEAKHKVDSLVAWRPINRNTYKQDQTYLDLCEDDKEYLVKWEKRSHYHCNWKPGAWVFGAVAPSMRAAFPRKNDGENLFPKFDEKEAVPEEYLLIDIILQVKYDSEGYSCSKEDDLARIDHVVNVYVKFQGLGYDNCVWDAPPERGTQFWDAFEAAYHEYLNGKHFRHEPIKKIRDRIAKFRNSPFKELKEQPPGLRRGKLMEYQLEGVNWLLYNYYKEQSVILADEMGLGKTVQVVGLITALIQQNPRCYPFLVVVPNSTCPNWRREMQRWAPDVRVVSYHGGKEPQELVYNYELFPKRCSDMKAHVVVMSYDSAQDDRTRTLFKTVPWAGLIVDEGQRLKNDQNLLYNALQALRIPWRVLLTGTPLQNNKRELFNLIQFIDGSRKAEALDQEYAELNTENITKLHNVIRPYFLRRTKAQVLKFLPAMGQLIIPLSMTILQEKLCKSIMAKNPQLIRAIFSKSKIKQTERSNLNNILMQLRKCLCHPFIYSKAIEEKNVDQATMHRNLIEASAKLIVLDVMLPKLKEQGHRVLLFSQFLDQLDLLEDYLTGANVTFQRLDGSMSSLEKQKRIDAFNAPESPYFVFLLSTRAGGVGINLATADTVIILDPDFNPHQDIQALSRAHRIGQKKKVLCLQFVTKNSVEEKIMQIGRSKLALDHALIESMGAKDNDAGRDLESILKHGAEALFSEREKDIIRYDAATVEKLLDRSHIEDSKEDKGGEGKFSYARIWANEKDTLVEGETPGESSEEDRSTHENIWDAILKQREADAQAESEKNKEILGRGGRQRRVVKYHGDIDEDGQLINNNESDYDGDFIDGSASDDSDTENLGQTTCLQVSSRNDLQEFQQQDKVHSSTDPQPHQVQVQGRDTVNQPVPLPRGGIWSQACEPAAHPGGSSKGGFQGQIPITGPMKRGRPARYLRAEVVGTTSGPNGAGGPEPGGTASTQGGVRRDILGSQALSQSGQAPLSNGTGIFPIPLILPSLRAPSNSTQSQPICSRCQKAHFNKACPLTLLRTTVGQVMTPQSCTRCDTIHGCSECLLPNAPGARQSILVLSPHTIAQPTPKSTPSNVNWRSEIDLRLQIDSLRSGSKDQQEALRKRLRELYYSQGEKTR